MRHRKRGRKLGVDGAHRKALGRNMVQSLIDHERIITTVPKAKQFKPLAEKVINLAKEKTLHNIRRVEKLIGNRELDVDWYDDSDDPAKKHIETVLQKLFDDIGPRNRNREGGYTRILRLAKRRLGDGGERCIFELVESEATSSLEDNPGASAAEASKPKKTKAEGKSESKKEAAAAT